MSTKSARNNRKRIKVSQGFDLNPPRCINCQHYVPPAHGVPKGAVAKEHPYRARRCGLGGFEVMPWSVCDRWTGADGEILEN